jgi:hypothetical protein
MPDEVQTPDAAAEPVAPAPQFDTDALASQVAEKLKGAFQQSAPQQPAPPPQPAPQPASDPVGDMVRPYYEPGLRAASLAAEMATDAAHFYSEHQDLDKADKAEIERRAKALAANGHAFTREDVYRHWLGENIDSVVEKRMAKREDAAKRALEAGTIGAGSADRGTGPVRNAADLPINELENAMKGMSF